MESPVWFLTVITISVIGESLMRQSGAICTLNSNTGRLFYMTIPLSINEHFYKDAYIYIASSQVGTAHLVYPASNINNTYSLGKGKTEVFLKPRNVQRHGKGHQGLVLTSDVDITVTMFIESSPIFSDEMLILPATSLSTNYTVPSAKPFGYNEPSEIIIVATQANTSISVEFPSRISSSMSTIDKDVLLDSLDTYIITGTADFSGTRVKGDKPIVVISAVEGALVPSFHPGINAEATAEFLPPDNFGGKNFIVPNLLPGRKEYSVRVMAIEPGTSVTFRNSTRTFTQILRMENTDEFGFENDTVAITANKPVMVYQYGVSSDNDPNKNGAFLRTVPAVKNFVTEAQFVVQTTDTAIDNVIQIIVPTGEIVQLDGQSIATLSNVQQSYVNVSGQPFTVYTKKDVSPGYHVIEGGMVPFGALITGQKGLADYIGYGNAIALRNPVGDHRCLSCEDVTHVHLCNVFERCSSNQVCFVEQYKNYANQTRYRLGCRETDGCSRLEREDVSMGVAPDLDKRVSLCVQCCHGNFCNTQGCESEAPPPRQTRGPLCLSCAHVQNPDECNTLAYCQSEEVCYVGKSNLLGDVMNYSFGCESKKCRAANHGKILCEQCCQDDFCNHACNSTSLPEIIG